MEMWFSTPVKSTAVPLRTKEGQWLVQSNPWLKTILPDQNLCFVQNNNSLFTKQHKKGLLHFLPLSKVFTYCFTYIKIQIKLSPSCNQCWLNENINWQIEEKKICFIHSPCPRHGREERMNQLLKINFVLVMWGCTQGHLESWTKNFKVGTPM